MAWQQRLEAMKATRVDRTTVGGLVLGGILGLALGLLIGWVWWPVEWQGPEPAAPAAAAAGAAETGAFTGGSQFDAATTRALFLGATADAFVYATGQGSRDAAAMATQRLAALGGDLPAAFDQAIAFYEAQPAAAAQVSNLNTLAAAVGITPSGSGSAGDAAAAPTAAAAAAAAPAGQTAAGAQTGATLVEGGSVQGASGNLLGWVASLLVAALLIGGGVFLLLRLNRTKGLEPSSVGSGGSGGTDGSPAFDDEQPPAGAPSVPAFDRDSLSPMRAAMTPAASVRSSVERPVAVGGREPHGFDAEDDEDAYPPAGPRTVTAFYTADEDYVRDPQIDARAEDDDWNGGAQESEEEEGDAEPPPVRSGLAGTSVRTPPPPTLQPPTPSRFDRYSVVESFTYTYYLGQVDTDKGKHLSSPSGDYIGEFSVGLAQDNGVADNDMMKPAAMEVVLFDKTDGRTTHTTTRVLLSEYAHDHLAATYERANPNLAPIVAQSNTRFQLEGSELLLDVLIQDVKYTREGFFQNLTLDLTAKRKT